MTASLTADHTFTFSVSNNDNDSEFQRENIMSKSVTIICSSGFCWVSGVMGNKLNPVTDCIQVDGTLFPPPIKLTSII